MTLTNAFCNLKPVNILIIGDLILDLYTKGYVNRISPEAPVPVLHVTEQTYLPGGAANVARNLTSLGAAVTIMGRIGDDADGDRLVELLSEEGIPVEGIYVQRGVRTPMKNRMIAGGQQLLRTDYEKVCELSESLEMAICQKLRHVIKNQDLVAISDYAKGFLTNTLLQEIMTIAEEEGVKVLVDPKGSDFSKYKNAFMIKPNNGEAYAASELDDSKSIEEVAAALLEKYEMEYLLITRSEKGMMLFDQKGGAQEFAALKKDVLDVTGAGDTALAMLAFAIAGGLSLPQAIDLSNIASGIAIESLGCVKVRLSNIAKVLLQMSPNHKIFEEKTNFFVLEKSLQSHKILIFELQATDNVTADLYHSLREVHKAYPDAKKIIYAKNSVSSDDIVGLLASMHEVDFVLLTEEAYCYVVDTYEDVERVGEKALTGVDWGIGLEKLSEHS